MELLTLAPTCTAVWVPFDSASDSGVLPRGTVVGGNLADGTPLYVSRVFDADLWGGTWQPGYYNPETRLSYAAIWVVKTFTNMEVLVLL